MQQMSENNMQNCITVGRAASQEMCVLGTIACDTVYIGRKLHSGGQPPAVPPWGWEGAEEAAETVSKDRTTATVAALAAVAGDELLGGRICCPYESCYLRQSPHLASSVGQS